MKSVGNNLVVYIVWSVVMTGLKPIEVVLSLIFDGVFPLRRMTIAEPL